ncbi:MAG: SdpI family protein [Pseudomonadales bacterium]|nr:SdpI family protein [Pseudomonadales bacterium]
MSETREVMSHQVLNRMFLILGAMVLTMFVVSGYAWLQLPADILVPVHWGIDGEPDRYAGKTRGLFLLPFIALLISILIRIIPVIEPRRRNLLRSVVAYRVIGLSLGAFFLVLHLAMVGDLLGLTHVGVSAVVGLLVSALITILGNYLGKVRSNFMFGIRTPWTLSSNLAWDKTHRLGGRLFVASGLIGIGVNLVFPLKGLMIFMVLLSVAVAVTVIYSYVVWRTAPDRRTE